MLGGGATKARALVGRRKCLLPPTSWSRSPRRWPSACASPRSQRFAPHRSAFDRSIDRHRGSRGGGTYPLASVVSNPLYKGFLGERGMNISRPFGFICPRGMQKGMYEHPWMGASDSGAGDLATWRCPSDPGECSSSKWALLPQAANGCVVSCCS